MRAWRPRSVACTCGGGSWILGMVGEEGAWMDGVIAGGVRFGWLVVSFMLLLLLLQQDRCQEMIATPRQGPLPS